MVMCTCNWISLLYSRYYYTVNQLYFNKTKKEDVLKTSTNVDSFIWKTKQNTTTTKNPSKPSHALVSSMWNMLLLIFGLCVYFYNFWLFSFFLMFCLFIVSLSFFKSASYPVVPIKSTIYIPQKISFWNVLCWFSKLDWIFWS